MRINIKKIALCGMVAAIGITLQLFFTHHITFGGGTSVRIGFANFTMIFSGLAFGPIWGGITAGIIDVVPAILRPVGPINPGITASAVLTGVIPGLFYLRSKKFDNMTYLYFATGFTLLLTGGVITTYFLSIMFGAPFVYLLPPRLAVQAVMILFYPPLLAQLLKATRKFR